MRCSGSVLCSRQTADARRPHVDASMSVRSIGVVYASGGPSFSDEGVYGYLQTGGASTGIIDYRAVAIATVWPSASPAAAYEARATGGVMDDVQAK